MIGRHALTLLTIGLLACSAWGCTTTRVADIRTGILDDNIDRLLDACDKIDQMEKGAVDRQAIEALGINFDAPNIQVVHGAPAFTRMFGGGVIAGSKEAVKGLSDYKLYIIPYRKITIVSDRIYFSEKEIKVEGYDMTLFMIFEKDVLYYSDYRYVYVDTYSFEYAFAQVVVSLLQSPREIMEALNEFLKQNPWLYPDFYPGLYVPTPP